MVRRLKKPKAREHSHYMGGPSSPEQDHMLLLATALYKNKAILRGSAAKKAMLAWMFDSLP